MKILVTGGNGFVGTNLIKRLLADGYDVISIDDLSTGKVDNEQKGANYIYEDLNMIKYCLPVDVVFHLAARARIQPSFEKPREYFKTNIDGTYDVVEYCTKHNIPLIYAGSSSHHSGKFKNPYTFTKDVGEEILELYGMHFGLEFAIARFYNVYGPHQLTEGGYTTLIGRWIHNIQNNIQCEIYGDGEQRRDFTHVDDIVDGLVKIMEKKIYNQTYEFGRGKNYSVNEVAEMFGITPVYKEGKKGEARDTLCNYHFAKNALGWEPKINLEDYIKNYKWT